MTLTQIRAKTTRSLNDNRLRTLPFNVFHPGIVGVGVFVSLDILLSTFSRTDGKSWGGSVFHPSRFLISSLVHSVIYEPEKTQS